MMQIHETGELFKRVQLEQIFPDGKTFPDCSPKTDTAAIKAAYEAQKDTPGFDLNTFVLANFDLPKEQGTDFQSDTNRSIEEHIDLLWDVLTRQPDEAESSLLPLPHPYIVPGGRFREIYYWDSYFTMLGLRVSGRNKLIRNMVDNFAHLIDTIGYIPNGNRSYYLGRSQPPFFAMMVRLLGEIKGAETMLQYLPQIEREYQFWMNGADTVQTTMNRVVRMPDGSLLNRYWDANDTPRPESYREDIELAEHSGRPVAEMYRHLRAAAESGWDFSSRWFRDAQDFSSIHTTDLVPVDLNCLLWNMEMLLSELYERSGNSAQSQTYRTLADSRTSAILTYCWSETEGFFFDFDISTGQNTPHRTLAAAYPLFFGIATADQAQKVAAELENRFLQEGGLRTTLQTTGQQWDAPNGWAPLQWIAFKGLQHYNFDELATRVRNNWIQTNKTVYRQTGKMMEKYNVFGEGGEGGGGEYPNQDGFGWTNGVALGMMNDEEMRN